jgi:hypothetical protein
MNRKTVITTVVAGLLIAGLPPAVAAAAPDPARCVVAQRLSILGCS